MKKNLSKQITLAILAGAVLLNAGMSNVVLAADVSGNTKTLYDGKNITGTVYGGKSDTGSAYNNTVILSGGRFDLDRKEKEIIGGESNLDSYGNKVEISRGKFNLEYGSIYGGKSNTAAHDNSVEISGGVFDIFFGDILGGFAKNNAYNNVVDISGNTSIKGHSRIFGGMADTGDIAENKVNISGNVTIKSDVFGGYSGGSGNVIGNIVSISGNAVIENDVYGGSTVSGDARDNVVNFHDTPSITGTVYGGDSETGKSIGNTFNVYTSGVHVGNIASFNNLNFYIPDSVAANDKLITITENADTDISNSTVKAGLMGDTTLSQGDKVYLLYKDGNGKLISNGMKTGKITEGVSVEHDITIQNEDGKHLVLVVDRIDNKLNEKTKSLVETSAATAAIINASADQLVNSGIAQAVTLSKETNAAVPFATASSGKMRINTGSHVDLNQRSVTLGLAKTIEHNSGKLTFGPTFEYGWGSYDSYLNNGIHAEGKIYNTGGGVFAHNEKKDGTYVEGSLRIGRARNDYKSGDMRPIVQVSYNSSSTYYGAHFGVGKIFSYDQFGKIDVYGRYLFNRSGSDTVKLSSGETYKFDAVNSNRFQLGGRYTMNSGFYAGAAWQYEASGSARATYKGMSTQSPSLKGHTGIVELGWQEDNKKAWDWDLGLTGYVGQNRGVTMHLGAVYNF